ncbi:MAG: S-layer homology domain-containing protein, partial [Acidobacteriota bacterium]
PVTRAQLAILLLRAEHGSAFTPDAPTGTVFSDVPADAFGAAWIEALSGEGVTSGCGSGNFCPAAVITRAPLAVLLLKATDGSGFRPEAASGTFGDVPASDPFAPWIEELFRRGWSSGCAPGSYCPALEVSRAQLAAFLTRAFSVPLPP